ncbi:hypothetical protein GPX89_17280 [Nocardia sp. ET3-3]|uniref:Protein kinase domain-containing protein n=1 Tax=Nocardia terrae TaxID=2675851 RepID=A0A7K1UXG6_9NOCA|nr:hypothetical protein [Nocardia terrae]MVU78992.1 hypothetical protein [Nocardia terrae]
MPERFRITGASGDVYSIDGATVSGAYGSSWLHECRDQAGRARLFREFGTPLTDPGDLDRVGKVTATGRGIVLGAEQAAVPVPVPISWPIDQVWRDGALAGVILPAVSDEFARADGIPQTLDQLIAADSAVETETRVAVAIRFCELFEMLERNELVHGDIAPHNLLWSRSGVYLRGGDGLRSAQADPVRQRIADGWGDPRVHFGAIAGHDRYSDRLGVALLVYRTLLLEANLPALVNGRWFMRSELPSGLDAGLLALIERAFDNPSATEARPAAGEWRAALVAAFRAEDGVTDRRDALSAIGMRTRPVVESPSPVGEPAGRPVMTPVEEPAAIATEPAWSAGASVPPTPPPPGAGLFPVRPPEPQRMSGGPAAALVAGAVVAIVLIVLGVRAMRHSDHGDASSTSTYSPYTYTSTSYSYSPPTPTTPAFNWASLDSAATDKTPFTGSALLPQSFRDGKNVNYTLRSSGVMDCITADMSSNVKSILRSYNCGQQVAGSYVDDSNQIMVSVNVLAFNTTADADQMYATMKGQTQDWAIWCPHDGAGAEVCNNNPSRARRTGYSAHQSRYVFETTALYINLSRDASTDDWTDPAAKAAADKAGPENYWHK